MLVVLGNQLFAPQHLPAASERTVFMAEDLGLCTYEKHHQQKIVLFLAAMRSYADELREAGYQVHYELLDTEDARPYEDKLFDAMQATGTKEIAHFED
ncbi:MAG TPA: cryptochrome/photolyase family protein, partial [Gammaproteobacteria bacterium]